MPPARSLTLALAFALAGQAALAHPPGRPAAEAARRARSAYQAADAAYQQYSRQEYGEAARSAARAVQLAPQERRYRLLLVRALLADGRVEEASAALEAAAGSIGENIEFAAARADITRMQAQRAGDAMYRALAQDDPAGAIEQGQLAVRLDASNPTTLLVLAHTLLRAQRPAEAERAADAALQLSPDDAAAFALRGLARQAAGRDSEADADLERALRAPGLAQPQERALRLAAADLALARGEGGRALALLESLAADDPEAAPRRAWAQEIALAGTRPTVALPGIDCTRPAGSSSCLVLAGALAPLPGFDEATAGYAAMAQGDAATALQHARLATATAPGEREWRLLYARAALAAGELAEAAAALRTAPADTDTVRERLAIAYAYARARDDSAALSVFRELDAGPGLPPGPLLDAAYTAMRADQDAQASTYFQRAVAAADAGQLSMPPQQRYEVGRAASEVARTWGFFASAARRNGAGVEPRFGAVDGTTGDQRNTSGGFEAYWRPWGYRHGAYAELFLRGYGTFDAPPDGVSGSDSFQGGAGARWKPLPEHNLVLSFSRVFGPQVKDSWLAQVGYSLDLGGELRMDTRSWWTTRLSAEAGRYFGGGVHANYAVASITAGRSMLLQDGGRTVVYPHVFLGTEHRSDDPVARTSSGAGVGVSLRQWFREQPTQGPRSYWEVTLEYRARLSGDNRLKGPYLYALLSF